MSCDSGLTVTSSDKTLGYLAQHQDMDGTASIYDALLEIKQPVIDMENRLRQMEQEMNLVTGEGSLPADGQLPPPLFPFRTGERIRIQK